MAIESTGNNTLLVNIDNNVNTVLLNQSSQSSSLNTITTNQSSQSSTLSTISTNVSSTLTVAQSLQTSAGKIVYAVFTASGTWTRPSGVQIIDVTLVGGGGGGGPAVASFQDAATAFHIVAGGGGAGGQVVQRSSIYVGSYSSIAVTVGAGGSGGSVSGSSTSAITIGYPQDGSPSFIVGNTDTIALASGGSFGTGAYDETGNGITFSLSGTAPSGNSFNTGGRAVTTTGAGSSFYFAQGGCGAGSSGSGFSGVELNTTTSDQTEGWQGKGFIHGIWEQIPYTQVASSSVVAQRSKIKWSNVTHLDGGTIISNQTTTIWGTNNSTAAIVSPKNTAIGTRATMGANNLLSNPWFNGTNWFLSEIIVAGITGFVGALPVGSSYQTSAVNTFHKISLSSPGKGTNGYGNGGWGGIIMSNSITSSSFNQSSFIPSASSSRITQSTNTVAYFVGAYETRVAPTIRSAGQTNAQIGQITAAGADAVANTGDGGNGAIAISATSSALGVGSKGGDGGSGICIISYSV